MNGQGVLGGFEQEVQMGRWIEKVERQEIEEEIIKIKEHLRGSMET